MLPTMHQIACLSPVIFVTGVVLMMSGVSHPLNLTLLVIGAILVVAGKVTFPKVQHPLYARIARFVPAMAAKLEKYREGQRFLKGLVHHNAEAAEATPQVRAHHKVKAQLNLIVGDEVEGTSWVGGLPRIPDDRAWPEVDGWPALFLAQIALSDLPEGLWDDLGPRTGSLLFFWPPQRLWRPDRTAYGRHRGKAFLSGVRDGGPPARVAYT